MFATRFIRPLRISASARQFSLTVAKRDVKPTPSANQASKPVAETQTGSSLDSKGVISGHMHNVSDFDRWMLVWVKRYPSKAEVPPVVTQECLLTARSRARIKTCNYMIVATIIMFIGAVISGKRDAAAGNTLQRRGELWHQQIQEQAAAERAAAAKKAAAAT